jgi:hypothetical protein
MEQPNEERMEQLKAIYHYGTPVVPNGSTDDYVPKESPFLAVRREDGSVYGLNMQHHSSNMAQGRFISLTGKEKMQVVQPRSDVFTYYQNLIPKEEKATLISCQLRPWASDLYLTDWYRPVAKALESDIIEILDDDVMDWSQYTGCSVLIQQEVGAIDGEVFDISEVIV